MTIVNRGLAVFVLILAMLLGAVAYEIGWLGGKPPETTQAPLPVGGPFTLTDQNGDTRSDSDFRGKLMLVYFGYTYCPDACPAALLAMSQALDQLGDKAGEVQPIFITIDPARDTIAQMKLYAANFHPSLLALTGSPEALVQAEKEYRVYAEKVPQKDSDDYLEDHSSMIYLMGRDGKLLTLFSPGASADSMAATIKTKL
ncbi:MAG TPA: SCO family protein [Stellaceae bacterium]|nr:SCO family protein [Stellaceae bacterium]